MGNRQQAGIAFVFGLSFDELEAIGGTHMSNLERETNRLGVRLERYAA